RFGIAHEILDATAIRRRFPQFVVRDDERGYFEPEAGYLRPEACVKANLLLAQRAGASLHTDEPVSAITQQGSAVVVKTAKGEYSAKSAVVCAGAGIVDLVPQLRPRFTVSRQVQYWF